LETHVSFQLLAHATKHVMLLPTHALTAQLVNLVSTTDNAKQSTEPAMLTTKFNWVKLNATNAQLVKLVKLSLTTNVSLQFNAHATKHVMLLPTHALAAHKVLLV
jgi:hypothetical protein